MLRETRYLLHLLIKIEIFKLKVNHHQDAAKCFLDDLMGPLSNEEAEKYFKTLGNLKTKNYDSNRL